MKQRKFLATILSVATVLSCITYSALAVDSPSKGTFKLEPLTQEEVIQHLADNNNISYFEASQKYAEYQKSSPRVIEEFLFTYVENVGTRDCPCEIEVGAIVELNMVAGYREFVDIVPGTEYAQCISSGYVSYDCKSVSADILNPQKIKFITAGTAYVEIDVSEEAEFGADLEVVGFSVSETVGSTITYRKSVHITGYAGVN